METGVTTIELRVQTLRHRELLVICVTVTGWDCQMSYGRDDGFGMDRVQACC